MEMELSTDEFSDHSLILRGKRSKRRRPNSSINPPAVTSSSSSGGGGGGGGHGGGGNYFSIQSPAISTDVSATNEEELEEMADCLIMLAQSLAKKAAQSQDNCNSEKQSGPRFTDQTVATAVTASTPEKTGFSTVYECKTCNRTFPSFQALGGHRASHNKPKVVAPEEAERKAALILPPFVIDEVNERTEAKVNKRSSVNLPPVSQFQIGSSSKVHECSICGAEFSSGQALGGHMRRHRAPTTAIITTTTASPSSPLSPVIVTNSDETDNTHVIVTNSDETDNTFENRREMLLLDLNLPAPEGDQEVCTFPFTSNSHQQLLFSAPAAIVNYQF